MACAGWQWLATALLLLLPAPPAVCKLASLRCTEHTSFRLCRTMDECVRVCAQ